MAGRGHGPDFVEALARGLDILAAFGAVHRAMSLTEVAAAAGLARPTARRLLLTLEELGYVRSLGGAFELTPKVMNLGMAYVSSLGLWDIARPHLEALVARTGESSSMAQLDGSDIVYVARVSVPKLIALRVEIGTHFPAVQTSQGKVLLAALPPDRVAAALAQPSRSGLPPYIGRPAGQLRDELTETRARDDHAAAAARSPAGAAHHGGRDQRGMGGMAFPAAPGNRPATRARIGDRVSRLTAFVRTNIR
jgi:IclR family pca regulon transcriptional regulator